MYANGQKLYQFKAKRSEIKPCPFCLGIFKKDFTVDNMKRTGSTGYVSDVSVDYDTIDVIDIVANISKY